MDELKPIEVADAGGLPEALRSRVRRRRVVHRARVGGGVVCVLLVAVVGVLVGRRRSKKRDTAICIWLSSFGGACAASQTDSQPASHGHKQKLVCWWSGEEARNEILPYVYG